MKIPDVMLAADPAARALILGMRGDSAGSDAAVWELLAWDPSRRALWVAVCGWAHVAVITWRGAVPFLHIEAEAPAGVAILTGLVNGDQAGALELFDMLCVSDALEAAGLILEVAVCGARRMPEDNDG